MKMPSINVFKIAASADPELFESMMSRIGLPIIGIANQDPLRKDVQVESIKAMADVITEDVDDNVDMHPALRQIKTLAESMGYIVSVESAE